MFESNTLPTTNHVTSAMFQATKTTDPSKTSAFFMSLKYYQRFSGQVYRGINEFVQNNKKTFDRILSNAKKFKFLGSGSYGDVYDLGDYIFKIEINPDLNQTDTFSSSIRGEKTVKALRQPENKSGIGGRALPMIYDSGKMNFFNRDFYWEIKEKFDTEGIDQETKDLFDDIIFPAIADGSKPPKEVIQKIGEKLRLSDDWFRKLKIDVFRLSRKDILDFHAGNIGVRRVGAEGYIVFFD